MVNERIGRVEDTPGPQAWFNSLPIVTRYWFGATFAVTCMGNTGTVNLRSLIFQWEPLKDNFEVWRLVTPFLYLGKFSLATLIGFYFLQEYSKRYELSSGYNTGAGGGTADYVFLLLFGITLMLLTYPFLTQFIMPVFGTNLTYHVLYIWTKRNPTTQVSVWGFPVPALYLPFVLIGLSFLMGNFPFDMVHGCAIGHIYYFLVDVVPLVYGKDILHTPQFLINYFGVGMYTPPTENPPPRAPAANTGGGAWNAPGRVNPPQDNNGLRRRGGGNTGGYNWGGSGRVLGSQ